MQLPKHLEPLIFKKFTKEGNTYKVQLGITDAFLIENTLDRKDFQALHCTINAKKIDYILNKIKVLGYEEIN